MAARRAKIVAITSRKGGVGKTVITSLMARYFTEVEGKKVLVVDFDARAGISSIFYEKPFDSSDMSIAEMLLVAYEKGNIQDAYSQTVLDTGMEKSKHWEDNGGRLFLIPSKPALESVLIDKNSSLLKMVLHDLGLTEDYVILINSGSDSRSVLQCVGAADVVFLPVQYSRQDVRPTVETLRTIIMEQRENGNAVLGGMVVNQSRDTKWEQEYETNYIQLFDRFQGKTNLKSASDSLFIRLAHSRTIQRGTFLDWSLRDNYLGTAKQLADAVQAVEIM